MTHFFQTDANPKGYKLEEILILLRKDLLARAIKIADDHRSEALIVMANDIKILEHLTHAIELAANSTDLLDRAFGPSKSNNPRIGAA